MIDLSAMRDKANATPSKSFANTPNIIENQEDKESSQSGFNILGQPKATKDGGQGFNPNNFSTIAPKRTEDQKERKQQ